jgi:DNA-binding transcriptional MocR family regulator
MTDSINTTHAVDAQVYFAVIPEWVLDLPVSSAAIRVYCCLRRYADNKTGECYPSRKALAMRSRCSIATVDRCVKELVDNGAIRVAKRKNAAGDWTSNLYTVLALPNGVASNLSLPRTRIAATGSAVNDARTRPNLNDRQELQKKQHQRLYPDPNTFVPPAQLTKDELLALAVEMTELSATAKTRTQKATFQRLADRFGEQAMEMDND